MTSGAGNPVLKKGVRSPRSDSHLLFFSQALKLMHTLSLHVILSFCISQVIGVKSVQWRHIYQKTGSPLDRVTYPFHRRFPFYF